MGETLARELQILEELRNCDDEMSGRQLHRAMQNGPSRMGLTTVYRHLRALLQKGLIPCRNIPTGEMIYTPLERNNHHLTFVNCGQTMGLKYCPLSNIDFSLERTNSFKMLFHTLQEFIKMAF